MTDLDRRHFLGLSLGSLAAPFAPPHWLGAVAPALPPGERRLVVLELFGGNDGLNTLVPSADDRYHRARPTIGLSPGEVLRVDALNGLHPSLARTHARLVAGGVAIVRNVGYPAPNLSHFTSRDIWSTACLDPLRTGAGWLGRWAEAEGVDELALLAVGSADAPRILRGPTRVPPAVPELGALHFAAGPGDEARARERALRILAAPGSDERELEHVRAALALARFTGRRLAGASRPRRGAEYPATPLARHLAAVADTIAAGLPTRVFHACLSGFDTHTSQLARHALLLSQLDTALDAFLRDMASIGELERTLVMTVSEFGRRVAESGVGAAAGSDHGAASVQLLAGGRVRGGLLGAQPDLDALDEAGNLVQRVDFRSVLATVLSQWLGADDEALLGAAWPHLPLLETA